MADEHDTRSKWSTYETIKTEQDGATFILTLHRPQKRNIINKQMRAEVVDALMKVRADTSVRAIILWGGTRGLRRRRRPQRDARTHAHAAVSPFQ